MPANNPLSATDSNKNFVAKRDSNLELFRIITMLLIVAHHYLVNSGLTLSDSPVLENQLSFDTLFVYIFGAYGKIGINCFVLISGYFLCKSHITTKKFAKLLLQIMFYRVLISSIFWLTGYSTFSIKEFVLRLIPITSISAGFTNSFLIFYLCVPFLNVLVHNLKQKQHFYALILMGFTYVFLGSFPIFSVTMNYVSWFIVLYLIASYIRLYPNNFFQSTKFWGFMAIASFLLTALSVVACAYLGKILNRGLPLYFVGESNTFLALFTGLSLFMFFKNLKIKYNPFINLVASTCFGVFLIHSSSETMRTWLWKDTLKVVEVFGKSWMPLHAILSVLGIFVICSLIDLLRIYLLEKNFFKLWDKCWNKLSSGYKKIENYLFLKLKIKSE